MEVLLGFVLGIVASVIASFAFVWLASARQRPIFAALIRPRLRLRMVRDTPERQISMVIQKLFRAWCEKDIDSYLACWADDCVRVMGITSTVKEDKTAIAEKFRQSCAKYSAITVPTLVIENIRIAPDRQTAIAHVYYRFELVRSEDALPTIEHSREVYSLRPVTGQWRIAANIDHFSEITS